MRIQIIGKDNGLGLSHDHRVLSAAILKARQDAQVEFVDWQRPQDGKHGAAINFYLELLNGAFIKQARRNIYVPNPEWYFSHLWGAVMPQMDEVWAKTMDCLRIFSDQHGGVFYSGWTSDDIMDRSVERVMEMIHVAGGSSAKGTTQVLQASKTAPCPITVVSREWREVPPNVRLVVSPSDAELRLLQNRALIHLCPSSYEGFGHYINEARACGAFVITTNAPPMNELVRPNNGAGVGAIATTRQNLAVHHHVDPMALEQTMESVGKANAEAISALGAVARIDYEQGRADFEAFVASKLGS